MSSDEDLLRPDPSAKTPTMAEFEAMRETYRRMDELEKRIKTESAKATTLVPIEKLEETFKRMGEQMVGAGKAASRAVQGMMRAAMLPHRGGWIESVGWVCERCGAESMDLETMREVPCDGGA